MLKWKMCQISMKKEEVALKHAYNVLFSFVLEYNHYRTEWLNRISSLNNLYFGISTFSIGINYIYSCCRKWVLNTNQHETYCYTTDALLYHSYALKQFDLISSRNHILWLLFKYSISYGMKHAVIFWFKFDAVKLYVY